MRMRLVWLAMALACMGLVGLFALWFVQPGYRIDKLAIEKIKIGMTEDEVVRIVGMPPGDYRTAAAQEERSRFNEFWGRACAEGCALDIDVGDKLVCMGKPVDLSRRTPQRTTRQWQTNLQVLHVIFDDRETVTGFVFKSAGKGEDTSFEKLRRWLSF